MPFHTVESIVGTGRHWYGLVDIPVNESDKNRFCRQKLNLMSLSNNLDIRECKLGPAQYYQRMARPCHIHNSIIGGIPHGPLFVYDENMAYTLPHDKVVLSNSMAQLSILVNSLKKVLEFIQPSTNNLHCYGHQTRNLLLLASMDFENECRGGLNGHNYPLNRPNTADYVKVCTPLRLSEYKVKLSHYSSLPEFSPFSGWSATAATATIPWYDSYNAVKHDREGNFHKASLENAINAVCSVAIMLAAQYRIISNWSDQIGHFFNFVESPNWEIEDFCIPPENWSGWTPLTLSL